MQLGFGPRMNPKHEESTKSGKGTGLMIRLGDYCQGVARLGGFGLHVEETSARAQ
jgi:hypothetical protein